MIIADIMVGPIISSMTHTVGFAYVMTWSIVGTVPHTMRSACLMTSTVIVTTPTGCAAVSTVAAAPRAIPSMA
ncbi:hypothetical protein ACS8MQ_05445 [Pseudomonas sp. MAHUQ-62]|uniref:hypothetical protein n=1 Tax=Pseudomonas sp. GCM10023245 TaxID=3252652 RepID=UPI003623DA40